MCHAATLCCLFAFGFVFGALAWPFGGQHHAPGCDTRPSKLVSDPISLMGYRNLSDFSFLQRLRDSCGTHPFPSLFLAPITFAHDCFKVFSHYFFTGGDECPYDHRCYRPRRLELSASWFTSDTVCDANVPDESSFLEFQYCGLPNATWSQGYYRFSGSFVSFFPAGCFLPECGVVDLKTGVGIPDVELAFPVVVKADTPAFARVLYTERLVRPAHFLSKDGAHVCFAYKSTSGCLLQSYSVSALREHFLLSPLSSPRTFLGPGWSFSEGKFFLHDALEARRDAFCVHVKSSSRSLFAQFTQGIVSVLIYALRPVVDVIFDIAGSLLRTLVNSLVTDDALFHIAQFSLLHAALYYFTTNLYFHAILALLFVVRSLTSQL
ncbi:hypothetical protein [Beihai barnacle virus 2]|uniref:hypothetical protein n=1 Tax=Beihai barnacle virus 2 TaxID=1922360 RepID=UPI00090AD80E|nr:hypothetical protein [Beihai barnacle virus 2]APG77561.1 hypothetical protein [Beihai barnacle virus 2]